MTACQTYTYSISNGWIAVAIVVAALTGILVLVHLLQRGRQERRRFELMEAALRNPSLSPETQRDLVRAMTPTRGRLLFTLGWFGLFGGIGWMCSDPHPSEMQSAIIITVVSFAMLTLPIAMRELEARKA